MIDLLILLTLPEPVRNQYRDACTSVFPNSRSPWSTIIRRSGLTSPLPTRSSPSPHAFRQGLGSVETNIRCFLKGDIGGMINVVPH
jgi:hypothetical protein